MSAPIRVLIADDKAGMRKLIRMSVELRGPNLEIREAADTDAARSVLEQWRPHLIILDVMMPGSFDGLGLCRHIRSVPELRDTKVLMLSARSQKADIAQAMDAGADLYMTKPFSPVDLVESAIRLCTPAR
ncbi:response regulator [Sinimarinibacterium flocculans]|uniref:response regulator n=1 Tax=Sinimarinibacterium flocculans TaxID=985250 RepID=UPI00351589FE